MGESAAVSSRPAPTRSSRAALSETEDRTSSKDISGLETSSNRTQSEVEKRPMKACPWEAL